MAAADMRSTKTEANTIAAIFMCFARAAFCAFSSAVRGGFSFALRRASAACFFSSAACFFSSMRACFFSSAAWSFSAFSSASSRSRRCARVSVPGSFSEPSGVKLLFLSVKSLTSLVHLLLVKLGEKLLLALGQTDLVCRAVRVLYPRGIVYAAAGLRLKHDADKRV